MASVTFPPALGGDGSTVTDDSNPTTGLANGGHRARFVPALAQMVAVANGGVTQATAQVALAAAEADAAAVSEAAAAASAASAVNAPGTNATSTTSIAIGTGSKTLTVQTGKNFVVGQPVVIANTAAPSSQWMAGEITAYNSGTGSLTVDVEIISGSGTFTTWTIGLCGPVRTDGVTLNKFGALSTAGMLDWNGATNTQPGGGPTLLLGTATNGPGGAAVYYHALTFEYGTTRDGTGQLTQFAVPYALEGAAAGLKMWVRGRYAGVWTPWELVGGVEDVRLVSTPTVVDVIGATYVLTASTTLTLPASPKPGYAVNIVNRSGTTTCIVGRNASNIMGLAEDMTINDKNASFRLVFVDTTRGWVLA